jgi:long-chain acyl-CoA synthetase
LQAGAIGEVVVRGPGVIESYAAPADASPPRFWRGFYRTSDLGFLNERGELHLVGRKQQRINIGGTKVDPNEVRRVLNQILGVRDCKVEAEPGPRGLELIAATIVTAPGVELTRADVIRHCRLHLAEYKIPRVIRLVAALDADLTGKLTEHSHRRRV